MASEQKMSELDMAMDDLSFYESKTGQSSGELLHTLHSDDFISKAVPDRKNFLDYIVMQYYERGEVDEECACVAKAVLDEVETYINDISLDPAIYPEDILSFVEQFDRQTMTIYSLRFAYEPQCLLILEGWIILSSLIDVLLEHLEFESLCHNMDEIVCDDCDDDV